MRKLCDNVNIVSIISCNLSEKAQRWLLLLIIVMSVTASSPEASEIDKMTAEQEMVDIGGEFSLVLLADQFKKSQDTEEVSLAEYIVGYKEVYKFLCLMGTVFGWVGSDVYNKIVLLEKYLSGDKKEHYQTIRSMIEYEVGVEWY